MATSNIKKCRKCGERYMTFSSSGDRFCTNCGNKLPKPPKEYKCECGIEPGRDDKFCFFCGRKINRIIKKPKNGK